MFDSVLVNYNSAQECLDICERLLRSPAIGAIVVADNSGELQATSAEHEKVSIIGCGQNLGFARAVNLAAQWGSSPWILLINPDCYVDEDTVAALDHAACNVEEKVVALAPRVINTEGRIVGYGSLPTVGSEIVRALGGGWLLRSRRTGVEAVSGALVAIRRSAWNALGGFDERFFLYYEETDLWIRVRDAGLRLTVVPDCLVLHDGGCTPPELWHVFAASRRVFYRKWFGGWWRPLIGAWLVGGIARLARDCLSLRASDQIPWRIRELRTLIGVDP